MKSMVMLLAMVLLLGTQPADAARVKFSFIDSLLNHSEDVVKLGKRVNSKVPPKVRTDFLNKYPRLAKSGDELINGALSIEKSIAGSPSASRMIENGVNPAKVAVVASRSPQTIKTGEEIAQSFASNIRQIPAGEMKNLPAPAVNAFKTLDGNYTRTADAFLTMARRGGQKAVEVSQKLLPYIKLKNTAAITAMGLLAWHMIDPGGSEEAIEKFFKEHVVPVATAPVKGIIGAVNDSTQEILNTSGEHALNFAKNQWPWIIVAFAVFLFITIPNLRKLPFTFLNNFFGRINARLERSGPASRDISNLDKPARANSGSGPINIYKRKR